MAERRLALAALLAWWLALSWPLGEVLPGPVRWIVASLLACKQYFRIWSLERRGIDLSAPMVVVTNEDDRQQQQREDAVHKLNGPYDYGETSGAFQR